MTTPNIRILVVDDNPGDADLVEEYLHETKEFRFEIVHVEQLSEAVRRVATEAFDLVLLDMGLPDSQGIGTFKRMHQACVTVPIVVLTGLDDDQAGLDAVGQGAQEYLVKNRVNAETLIRAVRYAIARHGASSSKKGYTAKVFGFLGSNGGAGTTTVAVNVAACLSATTQKSVILAQLHYSFCTLALGQETPGNLSSLLDLALEGVDEHELTRVLSPGSGDVRVLFGPQTEAQFKEIGADHAQAIIRGLTRMANFVVVEFGSEPSAALQSSVNLCDAVVVVAERELGSVTCGTRAIRQLSTWGVSADRVAAVIVNRTIFPMSMELSVIKSQLGVQVLWTVPHATTECLQAAKLGLPLVLSSPDSDAAFSYNEIASRLSDSRGFRVASAEA